jgi:hypothetical protein
MLTRCLGLRCLELRDCSVVLRSVQRDQLLAYATELALCQRTRAYIGDSCACILLISVPVLASVHTVAQLRTS